MAQRYGRNQKRAARARIEELEKRAADLQTANLAERAKAERDRRAKQDAESRQRNAKAEALIEIAEQSGYIERAFELMSVEMGRKLGDELRPHAEKLLLATRDRKPLRPNFSAVVSHTESVVVLRGEVPQINYAVHIAPQIPALE